MRAKYAKPDPSEYNFPSLQFCRVVFGPTRKVGLAKVFNSTSFGSVQTDQGRIWLQFGFRPQRETGLLYVTAWGPR
jgi:hypothetical protein